MNHEDANETESNEAESVAASSCSRLDGYLDGDLSGKGSAEFAEHLAGCSACRLAADKQRWIEGLLASSLECDGNTAPLRAIAGATAAVHRLRRRRLVTRTAIAAAASIVALVAWRVGSPVSRSSGSSNGIQDMAAARPAAPGANGSRAAPINIPLETSAGRPATFLTDGDDIAVPLASPAPEVTVVQLYPTTNAERRQRLAIALSSLSSRPNGG